MNWLFWTFAAVMLWWSWKVTRELVVNDGSKRAR